MDSSTWYVIAIVIYLFTMLGIGFWSYRQTNEYDEYVLGGRDLNPFVAAMSAGASDMSGWLLMGLPGALFVSGMTSLWIAIGLTVGAWLNWKFVAPRLRAYSEVAANSITIPSFFENRLHDSSRLLRVISAAIIIFFFTFYVSSGMVAGGRYFESTFNGSYLTGMIIIAAVTVAYTLVGGFLAVSYTDAVQGVLMFLSLAVVPAMAIVALDNPADIFSYASHHPYATGGAIVNPTYFSMFSGVSFAVVIGNIAWGLGYFGQPHILVRFMALRSPKAAVSGRRIGISWMALSIVGAVFTALAGTVFFSNQDYSITDQQNYETIFLDMAQIMFHPLFAGLVLTAVLAAIMSTMSSQMLVVSSALIEDLTKIVFSKDLDKNVLINLSRTAVMAIAVIAAVLAINPSDSILGLVGFAWAGFGAAFGPIMLLSLYWKRLNSTGAIAGMLAGTIVTVAWGISPLGDVLYEIVPGFAANLVLAIVVSALTAKPASIVEEQFEKSVALAKLAKEQDAAFDEIDVNAVEPK